MPIFRGHRFRITPLEGAAFQGFRHHSITSRLVGASMLIWGGSVLIDWLTLGPMFPSSRASFQNFSPSGSIVPRVRASFQSLLTSTGDIPSFWATLKKMWNCRLVGATCQVFRRRAQMCWLHWERSSKLFNSYFHDILGAIDGSSLFLTGASDRLVSWIDRNSLPYSTVWRIGRFVVSVTDSFQVFLLLADQLLLMKNGYISEQRTSVCVIFSLHPPSGSVKTGWLFNLLAEGSINFRTERQHEYEACV